MAQSRMPRGALASPRHKLAAATPHVIVGATPPNVIYKPQTISYWGNQTDGDCVTAEEAFAKACYNPEIFITDQVAVGWATQNDYLHGAIIIDALEKMTNAGFQQGGHTYDDGPAHAVDWTNAALLQNAIAQGPVKLGIAADQLNSIWTGANGWFATGFNRDTAEDHCVSLCGYGTIEWLAGELGVPVPAGIVGTQPGYAMFTWSTIGIIDVPSMIAITQEAWLRTPTTIIN